MRRRLSQAKGSHMLTARKPRFKPSAAVKSKYNIGFRERRKAAFERGELERASQKVCSICRMPKAAEQFYKSNSNRDGLHTWCKECSDRRTVENGRKRVQGVSPEEVEAMIAAQNGRCAICCDDILAVVKRAPSVDHCHKSGVVRGVLCNRCNSVIGYAKDSVDVLRSAIMYLEKSL